MKIGRYQIIRELGRGGMGVVYLARDPSLNRVVAVKALLDNLKNDAESRLRFEQEANTMAALKHHAIVPVHDLGQENNQPYFVMPYMSGGSLADRLRHGPMTLPEVKSTLRNLAAALDKVHDHGLIHRDIKPANILFDQDGRLYLADFGIARPVVAGTVTRSGTEAYMAPEQRYGHNLDRRSDVYQLGVVLFQMLTRHLPGHHDIPSVYGYNPNLPPGCDEVIARALATKKEERYPTAGDLADDFTAVVEEESETRVLGGGKEAKSSFFRFRRVITTLMVLGVLILVGLMFCPRPSENPPIGLMISFTPQVDVKHDKSLKEAEVGLKLYPDDVVIVQANAGAVISLSCPKETLLLTVGALQNRAVNCELANTDELIAQLNPNVISSEAPTVVVLPPQQERSSRQVEAQTPLLLSPRNSLIANMQPTFHWQAVPGASGYRLSLNIPNAENWEVETTDTTLPYPTDKAPLPAGSTNIFVKLVTLDNPTEVEETYVDVMDQAAQAELVASEAKIRNLGVDETAQAYLLAQLYRQREMKAAAITQLEQITANGEAISADLWQQLGDLYFEIRLYTQAEEKYQNALSAASANDDQQTQATAYFGLAQTAYIFEEDEQALDYLEQAEALSRQIGDDLLSKEVVQLKQKIEELRKEN